MGGEAEAQRHKMSHVRLQTKIEGELETSRVVSVWFLRQDTTLGRAVDLDSAEVYLWLACHETRPYIFSMRLLSTALHSASGSGRSPRRWIIFLLEMKMRLTWPGESAVSTTHSSPSAVALLSWRQLLVMRDQCLSFERSWEKSWGCFSVVKTGAQLRVCVEKCKISSL